MSKNIVVQDSNLIRYLACAYIKIIIDFEKYSIEQTIMPAPYVSMYVMSYYVMRTL